MSHEENAPPSSSAILTRSPPLNVSGRPSPDPGATAAGVMNCWVVSDGRAGIENQALGLAEAVCRINRIQITVKHVRLSAGWRRAPGWLTPAPLERLDRQFDTLDPPYPDLWIGAGRQAVMAAGAVKKASPDTFMVQVQNPRAPLKRFDLVIPPYHDRLSGDNVFSIAGAPNRITQNALTAAAAALAPQIAHLRRPLVAVLIGGPNSEFHFPPADCASIAETLTALARGNVGLMVTTSRRTPPSLVEMLKGVLDKAGPSLFFAPNGEAIAAIDNPYPGLLSLADHVLVTPDSVNMIGEAASAGKAVQILPLRKRRNPLLRAQSKFDIFRNDMADRGHTRIFSGVLESWRTPDFDETTRAAVEIATRLNAMRGEK